MASPPSPPCTAPSPPPSPSSSSESCSSSSCIPTTSSSSSTSSSSFPSSPRAAAVRRNRRERIFMPQQLAIPTAIPHLPDLVVERILDFLFPLPRYDLFIWVKHSRAHATFLLTRTVCRTWDIILRFMFQCKPVFNLINTKEVTIARGRLAFEQGRTYSLMCESGMLSGFGLNADKKNKLTEFSEAVAAMIQGLYINRGGLDSLESQVAFKNMRNLKHLEIHHFFFGSNATRKIQSKNLETLILHHCHGVSNLRIRGPKLKRLEIMCSKFEPVSGLPGLVNLSINAPLLETFSISRCPYLESIITNAKMLTDIRISTSCTSTRRFHIRSPYITNLEFVEVPIKAAIFDCPLLRTVTSNPALVLESLKMDSGLQDNDELWRNFARPVARTVGILF